MRAIVLAATIVSAPALAQEPAPLAATDTATSSPKPARLALNTAALGAGLGLAGVAAYNLTQAREAYRDYLDEPDDDIAAAMLADDVRPRQMAGMAEAGLAVAALGTGVVLWVSTDGLDAMPQDAPLGRYALNTSVLGAGAGLGVVAVSNYTQARVLYDQYLLEEDDAAASVLYDELGTKRRAMAIEGVLAVACLGAGTALWARTDTVSFNAGPGAIGFQAKF